MKYKLQISKLEAAAKELNNNIQDYFNGKKFVDQIKYRVKTGKKFSRKIKVKKNKYSNPLKEIEDQIGFRIVVKYKRNVEDAKCILLRYFKPRQKIRKESDNPKTFDYEGYHVICFIPKYIKEKHGIIADFFEVQIHTLFQHAWSETTHDIEYKTKNTLGKDASKKLGWLSASAWGADKLIDEILQKN